ncbi:MAG: type VI secretion system baseplate subunit TssG [Desulfovibrio sp.]|jgi:type VI secretion system protein ImpH|nr:type VI secretion system baseplate subunit TssG [Desulfovibrio sp.]
MTATNDASVPTIIRDLLAHPQKFSFSQLVRLLQLWAKAEDTEAWKNIARGRLSFRPDLSLGFAVTDVRDLELELSGDPQDPCPFTRGRITASFLGLYGPSSPLPTFYTERLLDEQSEDRSVTRDFLDIINNIFFLSFIRLTSILFPLRRGLMEKDAQTRQMLMSLAGFGDAALRGRLSGDTAFLRYAGLFFQATRSAAGLRAIMNDAAGKGEANILCNVPRLVPVPAEQRLRLGEAACSLGEDAVLGAAVPCHEGKILIEFTRLDEASMRALLPGAGRTALLHDLVRNYCREPLEYAVVLRLLPGEARPLRLGGDTPRRFATLGHDAWTGFGGKDASAPLSSAVALFPAGFASGAAQAVLA